MMMATSDYDRDRIKHASDDVKKDLNADPITGEPGSHPVGTGLGATGGAAAGAAIGSAAGPVGTVVGGAVGAVVGGLAGHAAGEAMDPTVEDAYWRENSINQPYYSATRNTHPDLDYDRDYRGAYRVGYENRSAYGPDARFEDAEPDLRTKWEQTKAESRLSWEEAKHASRDAWNRIRH
jgi:hypothetical protein